MEVIRLASTRSTQDIARGLAVGSVVVADHQSAGRGRLSRRWEAPPGAALLASFVMAPRPLATLAAGVAAAAACGPTVRLKWPNDLLLGGRKLGGILTELRTQRAVIGIGINLTWAPEGAARLGPEPGRDRLLELLGAGLRAWFDAPDGDVLAAWRERSDTLGRPVRVELPGESFDGVAEDVLPDGTLVVAGRAVAAGDVIHLRDPAAPAAPPPLGP
jgi:BirA family biotin operon repressor/biotin-[acetyl-CoA-carboxylase] ligase